MRSVLISRLLVSNRTTDDKCVLRTDRSIVDNLGISSRLGEGDFGTDAAGRVGEEHGLTGKR
jgi:hypothetical protein